MRNHRKTLVSSVYLCLFPWESFSRHTLFISMCGKTEQNQFGPKQGCCPLQAKFRLLYDNSFAPAVGGAFAVGTNTMALIQRCQIQAIMTVLQRLSFSAGLTPPISITDFNIRCHLTYKVVRLIRRGGGVRCKKPGFLERKAYGKENPGSISKASMHDIRFQCQVEKAWM